MGKAKIKAKENNNQKNGKLKQQMKAKSAAQKPKKKGVKLADKNVRTQISNGELVKVKY